MKEIINAFEEAIEEQPFPEDVTSSILTVNFTETLRHVLDIRHISLEEQLNYQIGKLKPRVEKLRKQLENEKRTFARQSNQNALSNLDLKRIIPVMEQSLAKKQSKLGNRKQKIGQALSTTTANLSHVRATYNTVLRFVADMQSSLARTQHDVLVLREIHFRQFRAVQSMIHQHVFDHLDETQYEKSKIVDAKSRELKARTQHAQEKTAQYQSAAKKVMQQFGLKFTEYANFPDLFKKIRQKVKRQHRNEHKKQIYLFLPEAVEIGLNSAISQLYDSKLDKQKQFQKEARLKAKRREMKYLKHLNEALRVQNVLEGSLTLNSQISIPKGPEIDLTLTKLSQTMAVIGCDRNNTRLSNLDSVNDVREK